MTNARALTAVALLIAAIVWLVPWRVAPVAAILVALVTAAIALARPRPAVSGA